MKRYKMEVVSQTLYIIAEDEDQAEEKYNAFWSGSCPCGAKQCACVTEEEDVFHTTTEDDGLEGCGVCGEIKDTEGGDFSFAHSLYVVFTCKDCNEPDELNCGACGLFHNGLSEEHWPNCDLNPNKENK
jgi:hypothetical protein